MDQDQTGQRLEARPYEFRRVLETVHQPDRRNPDAVLARDEIEIDATWLIVATNDQPALIHHVARDLQNYFFDSMGVSLRVVSEIDQDDAAVIEIATDPSLAARTWRLDVSEKRIGITGADDRAAAQGSYALEDLLNLREAPFIAQGTTRRTARFAPRMIHSGWGLDDYPNDYLNRIAHAGFDTILVFVSGPDRTPDENAHGRLSGGVTSPGRYRDLNNLIDRAARCGIDVYFYAYFHVDDIPHPADAGAEDAYARVYGDAFRRSPGAKGLILVGESIEFPSNDPNTTGTFRLAPTKYGLPNAKPSPGWWPCSDYPEWLALVKKVVRQHNEDIDIVFWTYNWGYAPQEDRLALVRNLPNDVSLQVTFEMFEPAVLDGVQEYTVDYTASVIGPGQYFRSEAAVARENDMRLYTMCNTAGLTWDVGDIPYEPIPYQWARRHQALIDAQEQWGLSGLMESHHYGWWPSVASELAKNNYWTIGPDTDTFLRSIAMRDVGEDAADDLLAAWRLWSEAITHYVATNEDQYGPFRVGPSYPLVFSRTPKFPIESHAMFGDIIFFVNYSLAAGRPGLQSPGVLRIQPEINSLRRMEALWKQGLEAACRVQEKAPARKQAFADELVGLGQFVLAAVRTVINVKRWWLLKQELQLTTNPQASTNVISELEALAREEIANAESALPAVSANSRLGWEPSMGYVCGPENIR